MEKAVKNLEAMFQKTDSGINNLTQKLDYEFENNEEIQTNPAELVKRLSTMKQEYATLVQEAATIQHATQDAVQEFQGYLNEVLQLLMNLQTNCNIQGTEKPEELSQLEELLGTSLPWGQAAGPEVTTGPEVSEEIAPPQQSARERTSKQKVSLPKQTESAASYSPPCRQDTDDFVEVTEEEFESVSNLIRGRVKLADVNSAYKIVWNHFKTETRRKNDLLSPEDMHKMGMKVTGQTGQAKLKVLRALKLVRITTKGEVALI